MIGLLYALVFSLSAISISVVCPMIYYKYFQYDRTIIFSPTGPNEFSTVDVDPVPIIPPPAVKAPVIVAPTFVVPKVVDKETENAPSFNATETTIENTTNQTVMDDLNAHETSKPTDDIPPLPIETMTTVPEEPAMFKGGDLNVFHRWVQEQLVYPQSALDVNLEGRVIVEFTVGPQGKIDDIKVARSADPLLDNEVIRVLKQSPAWSEPRQSGRVVKQHFFMPVYFQLK